MTTEKSIALRPVQPDDQEFLYEVYASTRQMELAQLDWDHAQKTAFLTMQFQAQDRYYHQEKIYEGAEFQVILYNGTPAGRLYVHRRAKEIRIVDISLLPAFRNLGVGTTLLNELTHESQVSSKPVRILVERFNPAANLYHRLGFIETQQGDVYTMMQWTP